MSRVFLSMLLAAAISSDASAAGSEHFANAVKVERGDLVHTRQLFGGASNTNDFGARDAFDQLQKLCKNNGASLADVAKLNCYVGEDSSKISATVDAEIKKRWPTEKRPAITTIPTLLPYDAKIAVDAVFVTKAKSKRVELIGENAASLPADRDILYVSGRAASGELAEATAGTMQQLFQSLEHLGSQPSDVVQVKAFIKPMSQWKTVEAEIDKSFGDVDTPPVVYVEWTSKSRATEIELIAAAPSHEETGDTVSYYTPPGDKASPVFSRAARIHSDKIIYIGGTTGTDSNTSDSEVQSLFDVLRATADDSGTSLRHLAKATYYVSDDEVSAALNRLRPSYYDPKRPPAASKVQVPSIGVTQRGLLIDMVAAPASSD